MHPRTKNRLKEFGLEELCGSMQNLIITEPIGYIDFQQLMCNSRFVITDSGGIQEETTVLKIPCITMRENTERPITVIEGTNVIIGLDTDKLMDLSVQAINKKWKDSKIPELWDGKTAGRVVKILEKGF